MKDSGNTILITGGTSGIECASAAAFPGRGKRGAHLRTAGQPVLGAAQSVSSALREWLIGAIASEAGKGP